MKRLIICLLSLSYAGIALSYMPAAGRAIASAQSTPTAATARPQPTEQKKNEMRPGKLR